MSKDTELASSWSIGWIAEISLKASLAGIFCDIVTKRKFTRQHYTITAKFYSFFFLLAHKFIYIKAIVVMFVFRALPLKGITWQPHASHPLFIGVTLYCMPYCISVSILLEAATVFFFLPRVVFLPPTLPVSGFLTNRVFGTEVSLHVPLFIFCVLGCGNKLLSWPKTNCVVGGDNYDNYMVICPCIQYKLTTFLASWIRLLEQQNNQQTDNSKRAWYDWKYVSDIIAALFTVIRRTENKSKIILYS